MDERNDAREFTIAEAVIAHGARGFSNESAVPIIRIESVADLDIFDPVLRMIKEPAVTDRRALAARDNGELRWNAGLVPAHDFFNESNGLFAFGENAQRKAHEIRICKQLGHTIDVFLAERSQNQSLGFENRHWK